MTGYAVASTDSPRGALSLELRSVNSRYLDLQFRIADELRATEPQLREALSARLRRGKIDCRLSLGAGESAAAPSLNPRALESLHALASQVAQSFPGAAPPRVMDVLRWPGVLEAPRIGEEAMREAVAKLAARALEELCATRGREGARLAAIVTERVAEMRRRLAEVAPLLPEALAAWRNRLAERLREALGSGEEERVRSELAVYAARVDVDEELTRLAAHLDEVERTLKQGGAAGKRLDFLAQELNREANTLASKAAGLKIADCALELKLLVEQVREQVQNIE